MRSVFSLFHKHDNRLLLAIQMMWALTFLALASGAVAHRAAHPTTDPVTLALERGEEYWGIKPCNENVTVSASYTEPASSSGTFVPMWAHVGSCSFTISLAFWHDWRNEDANFQWFCDGVTHELGHLAPLDYGDSEQTNPTAIQYPVIQPGSPNFDSVPECKNAILWYGNERFT